MRTLDNGEIPRIGAGIRVIYDGTVAETEKSFNGKTIVRVRPNTGSTCWTFIVEGAEDRTAPKFIEMSPPPRTFKEGVMYVSTIPMRNRPEQKYFLRTATGWQGTEGESYPDNSSGRCLLAHIVDSLVELVPTEKEV